MHINTDREIDWRQWDGGKVSTRPAPCSRCNGTGAIDAPTSDDDPTCPDCDGSGSQQDENN